MKKIEIMIYFNDTDNEAITKKEKNIVYRKYCAYKKTLLLKKLETSLSELSKRILKMRYDIDYKYIDNPLFQHVYTNALTIDIFGTTLEQFIDNKNFNKIQRQAFLTYADFYTNLAKIMYNIIDRVEVYYLDTVNEAKDKDKNLVWELKYSQMDDELYLNYKKEKHA